MQNWMPDIDGVAGPKYLAIAHAMMLDIKAGRLTAGGRLPPQRVLADALDIDLTTVTRAYGEAQRLGLIESDGRRGSFVREQRVETPKYARARLDDAGMNAPPEQAGSLLSREYRRTAEALLGDHESLSLSYPPRGGMPATREAGAQLLQKRGIPCLDDTVLVTAGGQHALHAIFSAELRAGDVLAVAGNVYPGVLALARRFDTRLVAIGSDSEGIDPDALDALCRTAELRGVYVVPTNDNPTTATMSVGRRKAIAAVARRHGLIVIEDDAYGLLPKDPLPPIASFAPEQSWHIASTSKILSPGLRVAWLCAPGVADAWRLAADVHDTAIMAPPLNAAIVARWVGDGLFERLVAEIRSEAAARQLLVRKWLHEGSFQAHETGYHLWVPLPADINGAAVMEALRPHGLSVVGGEAFAVDRSAAAPALRISIGGALTRDRLEKGIRLLAALIGPEASARIPLV